MPPASQSRAGNSIGVEFPLQNPSSERRALQSAPRFSPLGGAVGDDFDADQGRTAGVSSALYVLRTTRHLISPRADTSASPSEIARAVDTADLGLRHVHRRPAAPTQIRQPQPFAPAAGPSSSRAQGTAGG